MTQWSCARCGETDESKRKVQMSRGKKVARNICRACANKASRDSRSKRAEHYRQKERERVALALYGLTPEQLAALGDSCHLCGAPAKNIDHCHDTGKVRGLLCTQCNTALGLFKDDPALLRRAADYVEDQ